MNILKTDVQNISNSFASTMNVVVGEIEANIKFDDFGIIL